MSSLYIVGGGVALVAGLAVLVAYISRKRGEERIAGDLAEKAMRRQEKFDEKMAEPVPTGDDAIDRLP